MAALQCDICGGSLTMAEGGEVAVCDSCGMKHDKRRVQQKVQEIRGSVKIDGPVSVEGVHNADKLAENAETFLSIGELAKAQKTFRQLADDYPADYRGWWGLARILPLKRIVYTNKINNNEMKMPDEYGRALQFAPAEMRETINGFYRTNLTVAEGYVSSVIKIEAENNSLKEELHDLQNERNNLSGKLGFPSKWLLASVVTILLLVAMYKTNSMVEVIQFFSIPVLITTITFIIKAFLYAKRKSRASEIDTSKDELQAKIRDISAKHQECLKEIDTDGLLNYHVIISKMN